MRQEISDKTDRITGKTKEISNGQSETIVQDIENMVRSYIEKANDSSSVPNTPLEGRYLSETEWGVYSCPPLLVPLREGYCVCAGPFKLLPAGGSQVIRQ
ncbi:hypothetical protein Fmac_020815 [Flemingia macrophylla]|uniref:Uncharacterized protein n=1 Tax=Flemingia macrophylla TaxID=520843 RepID=A0ABD1LV33_9FABA